MKNIIYILSITLLSLTACNKYNIEYDEEGNIVSMDDPGEYSSYDNLLLKMDIHSKTNAYIQYVDFLFSNDMNDLAWKKLNYARKNDNEYWLLLYVDAYKSLERTIYKGTDKTLLSALNKFDKDESWGNVNIDRESILRNLAYSNYKLGYYYSVFSYAQEALLLSKKGTPEYNTNLNLIIMSHLKNKEYEEAKKWAKKIDNKEKSDSLIMNCDRVRMREDSIENGLSPDYRLFQYLHEIRAYTKTYKQFREQFGKDEST